jgi:hypothetical protein
MYGMKLLDKSGTKTGIILKLMNWTQTVRTRISEVCIEASMALRSVSVLELI